MDADADADADDRAPAAGPDRDGGADADPGGSTGGGPASRAVGRGTNAVGRTVERAVGRADATLGAPGTVVAAVAAAVYLYRLGERPLWWWDESFYAIAARNAVEHGHWLVPHSAGFDQLRMYPFLEKPPLAMWLEAVSIWLLGPTEFAVRLPSALAAVGATLLAYAVARRLDGPAAGVVAAAVFLTTPAVLLGPNGARFGSTDLLHTFLGSAVVVLVWLRATDRATPPAPLLGATLAALLLTKGFAAGVFVVAAAPLVALRFDRFGRRYVAVAGGTAAALVGAWVVPAYLVYGDYLVQELFVEQVWQRLTGGMAVIDYATAVPLLKYPYATVVQVWFHPWWFPFLAGSAVAAGRCWHMRAASAADRIDVALPLWWAATIFVPFALTGTAPWYLIPMYVPAAVVVGRLVAGAAGGERASAAALIAGTALAVAAGTDRLLYRPGSNGGVAFDPGPDPAWTAALAVLVVLAGAWLLTTDRLAGTVRSGSGWAFDAGRFARLAVAGGTLALVVAGLIGSPAVYAADTDAARHHLGESTAEVDTAMRDLGQRTNRAVPPGETVYVQPNAGANWFYSSYAFYANRPLREVPVDRLRLDPAVGYVLVTTEGLALVDDRDPEVIVTSSTLHLVVAEVGPPAEE
ncbi:MAG: glycosyltransferase family 39 protein [Haloferacaceae archaeon]